MVEQLLLRERRFLLGLLVASGLLVLWVTRAYLAWAILGLILAYVTLPLHDRLSQALRGRRTLAAGIIVTGTLLAVAVPLAALAWAMAEDVGRLTLALSSGGMEAWLSGALTRFMDPTRAAATAASATHQIESFLVAAAPAVVVELIDATIGIFILVSAHFATLANRDALYLWVRKVLPLQDDREEDLLNEVGRAVDAVVFGIVIVAVICAVAGGLLWWASGLPNVILWTFVLFVFAMIPALGPSLVLYPGAIYAWAVGNFTGAAILVVGGSILIIVVDVYVRPVLIAKKGGLDGTLALLAVMGGIVAMGPIGIFAGPLVMAIFLKVVHLTLETHHLFGEGFSNTPRRRTVTPAPPAEKPKA